jgi:cell wall-associated NlpC family hydrolase
MLLAVAAPSALAAHRPAAANTGGTAAVTGGTPANAPLPAGDLPAAPGAVATVDAKGFAHAPAGAPAAVKAAIRAGNEIKGKPYVWGGGHAAWKARGYDCSGTVSYVLHAGGLLDTPLTSGAFARWGAKGHGRWITIMANSGHAYAYIAGLRLDTSGTGGSGPRWRSVPRSNAGFTARHPVGF